MLCMKRKTIKYAALCSSIKKTDVLDEPVLMCVKILIRHTEKSAQWRSRSKFGIEKVGMKNKILLILKKIKCGEKEEWRARRDSNPRPAD